jgi:hypothetical protein
MQGVAVTVRARLNVSESGLAVDLGSSGAAPGQLPASRLARRFAHARLVASCTLLWYCYAMAAAFSYRR